MTRIIYSLISIIAMAGTLFIAVKNVDIESLWLSLSSVSIYLLIGASLMALISMGFRAWRWGILLNPIKRVSFSHLLSYTLIGFMANNILPAHAGEIIKAFFLGKKEQVKTLTVFTTVLLERLFDSLALVTMMIVVVHLIPTPMWLSTGAHLAGIGEVLLLSIIMALALDFRGWRTRLSARMEQTTGRWATKICRPLMLLLEGLAGINSFRTLLKLFFISLITWLHMAATIWLILAGLPVAGEGNLFFASIVVIVILAFAIVIPSTPGYVGVTQLAFVIALSIFQVPETEAVSSSVIFMLTQYIPITVTGLAALVKEGISFNQLNSGKVKSEVLLNES